MQNNWQHRSTFTSRIQKQSFLCGVGEAQRETERYRRLEDVLLEAEIEAMKTPGPTHTSLELILSNERTNCRPESRPTLKCALYLFRAPDPHSGWG